jgi:archaeoflavoprotein AfpA
MRIVWGITGSGDRIQEIFEVMESIQKRSDVKLTVLVSKAGEQMLRWYKLWDHLSNVFPKVKKEVNANTPFIAGPLQLGKYDLLIVMPLTANSTAKMAHGIADTLITNAVAQTLKGPTQVVLYPVDQIGEELETVAPDGTSFCIRPRVIDVENALKLSEMEGVTVIKAPRDVIDIVGKMAGD